MLITLAVTSACGLLLMGPMDQVLATAKEKQFWQSFEQLWQSAVVEAPMNKLPSVINFNDDKMTIINGTGKIKLDYPETVTVKKRVSIKISKSGQITGKTVNFKSTLPNRNQKLVFQIGWGQFIRKDGD
ncbi:hypothetical protein [Dellaglioa sp. BT-FLS60]